MTASHIASFSREPRIAVDVGGEDEQRLLASVADDHPTDDLAGA